MINIAIFASGNGTNAEQLMKFFDHHESIHVSRILTNKKDAFVIQRAKKYNVPVSVFSRDDLYSNGKVMEILTLDNIQFIVLAGFLWLVPKELIRNFNGKIINIHPALLPKFGGKGMYGDNIHRAVIESGEKESGITIHFIDEEYDRGGILFQASCPVKPGDTPESLAERIHSLEYTYFPVIVQKTILKNNGE